MSEIGVRNIRSGDVVMLSANTLCGAEPDGQTVTTTLYLEREYVVDLVYWQHAEDFGDRLAARRVLDLRYLEPTRVAEVGASHMERLAAPLDRLAELTSGGIAPEDYFETLSHLFLVLNVVAPVLAEPAGWSGLDATGSSVRQFPRPRLLAAVRPEVREIVRWLHAEPARPWTLREMASCVHLSASQLSRVFAGHFGKTPHAYLTIVRVEQTAHLLSTTTRPVTLNRDLRGCESPYAKLPRALLGGDDGVWFQDIVDGCRVIVDDDEDASCR